MRSEPKIGSIVLINGVDHNLYEVLELRSKLHACYVSPVLGKDRFCNWYSWKELRYATPWEIVQYKSKSVF